MNTPIHLPPNDLQHLTVTCSNQIAITRPILAIWMLGNTSEIPSVVGTNVPNKLQAKVVQNCRPGKGHIRRNQQPRTYYVVCRFTFLKQGKTLPQSPRHRDKSGLRKWPAAEQRQRDCSRSHYYVRILNLFSCLKTSDRNLNALGTAHCSVPSNHSGIAETVRYNTVKVEVHFSISAGGGTEC